MRQVVWLCTCCTLIGISFMSGEAVPVYPSAAAITARGGGARLAEGAAWAASSARSDGPSMLPEWRNWAEPTVSVRRSEEARCEWQTDGWAFAGMVFIAWTMLWGLGVLDQASYSASCDDCNLVQGRSYGLVRYFYIIYGMF
jgi:hypothetical protein